MKILGIGNAIVDVICKVDDNFITNNGLTKSTMKLVDEIAFKKLLSNLKIEETVAGGSVANSIVGLAQLGNNVGFIGKINEDSLGKKYEEGLGKEKVKYFYSKKFTGLYEARNLAIEKARGDYISFLDTDDFWQKDKLIKQVNFFEKNDGFEAVYSNYYVLNEAKNKKYVQLLFLLWSI